MTTGPLLIIHKADEISLLLAEGRQLDTNLGGNYFALSMKLMAGERLMVHEVVVGGDRAVFPENPQQYTTYPAELKRQRGYVAPSQRLFYAVPEKLIPAS